MRAPTVEVSGICGAHVSLLLFSATQVRRDNIASLRAAHHRNNLERDPCTSPIQHPILEQPKVIALHELETTTEVGLDPTINVLETVWNRTAAIANALVDGDHVVVAKSLDDHE